MSKVDVQAMLAGMRGQLERDEAEGRLAGISVADLFDAMSHPNAPDVIAEAMGWEAGAVKQGEPAPDFTLPWLHGPDPERGESLTLSSHFGQRPVGLVFGSYT